MVVHKIRWDSAAKVQLRKALDYIREESQSNAEKVEREIFEAIEELAIHPLRYAPDKFRANNNGSFRALELYRYRIAYFVGENEIRILRIRHTSMEPIIY